MVLAVLSSQMGSEIFLLSHRDYPQRVAYSLIGQCLTAFQKQHSTSWKTVQQDTEATTAEIDDLLIKYQNPTEVDSIARIEKDLEETKEVLVKSIDQLLVRGEKLEDLSERSEDLSFKSKQFMKQSNDLNK